MRSCSPSRYSVSTVSSVRQTIRQGGKWRMAWDMPNYPGVVTDDITSDVIAGLDPTSNCFESFLTKRQNCHSGARAARTSDVLSHIGESRDSGSGPSDHPGMTGPLDGEYRP